MILYYIKTFHTTTYYTTNILTPISLTFFSPSSYLSPSKQNNISNKQYNYILFYSLSPKPPTPRT